MPPSPLAASFTACLKTVEGGTLCPSRTPGPLPALPPTCAAFLQAETLQDLLELGVLAEMGQLDVDAATQAGAQVGGAGQDVAQVLIPAEGVSVLLEDLLDLWGRSRGWQRFVAKQVIPTSLFLAPPPPKGCFSQGGSLCH